MDTDTLTVGYSIKSRERPFAALTAPLATLTDEAVTDYAHDTHPESLRVESETDGLDLAAVEHERQSRLRRWQRLP